VVPRSERCLTSEAPTGECVPGGEVAEIEVLLATVEPSIGGT
jgi:hypothetical protein